MKFHRRLWIEMFDYLPPLRKVHILSFPLSELRSSKRMSGTPDDFAGAMREYPE
jgi:hypothetical protein